MKVECRQLTLREGYLYLPIGTEVLDVTVDFVGHPGGRTVRIIRMWVLIDENQEEKESRLFGIFFEGEEVRNPIVYIGSYRDHDGKVALVFELEK
jgi:hypothetical protein